MHSDDKITQTHIRSCCSIYNRDW